MTPQVDNAAGQPQVRSAPLQYLHAGFGWLLCGAVTSCIAFLGAWFGIVFLPDRGQAEVAPLSLDFFAKFDGRHYLDIIEEGYNYDQRVSSRVAFFPAYPLSASWLREATGFTSVPAMMIVANVCMLAATVAMGFYLRRRLGDSAAAPHLDVQTYSLLAMCVVPTTFFFRMTYSESMFILFCILALFAMARNWPLILVAIIVGATTAIRPVGIGLLLPLAWYVAATSMSMFDLARRLAWAIPLGMWGLLAYMAFLQWQFGEPLAFALTQKHWSDRGVPGSLGDKLVALLSFEPIWSCYVEGSPCHWKILSGNEPSALFSLHFVNPIYFVGATVLVAIGAYKRWLTSYEVLLSIPLLAIPYLTRSYENCLQSHARFATVVFPVYIVMGQLLARLPSAVAIALVALSAFFMGIYSALFVTGHPFL